MKKKYISLALACVLCACSAAEDKSIEQQNSSNQAYCSEEGTTCSIDESADMKDYEGIDEENNAFVETSMDEALSIFRNKKTAILYFGYPDCPWCVEAVPILDELAKENNQQILYIRTRDDQKELLYTDDEKKELISYAKEYMNQDEEGKYQLYVPFVVFVKNGKIMNAHIGTVDGHDAHERTMTEDEQKELTKIYDEMFQSIE
ncbi:thioredoxin family protein [Erysipelotrichaceae bacterium HCN-30851]